MKTALIIASNAAISTAWYGSVCIPHEQPAIVGPSNAPRAVAANTTVSNPFDGWDIITMPQRLGARRMRKSVFDFLEEHDNFCNEYYPNSLSFCQKTLQIQQQTGCGLHYAESEESFSFCRETYKHNQKKAIISNLLFA